MLKLVFLPIFWKSRGAQNDAAFFAPLRSLRETFFAPLHEDKNDIYCRRFAD